jgi:4-diphosphocytidyl-2-C-methyl-D-erythritol kinase
MITFPNAKINLGLNVLGKRADGFHNIETVFYPVQWCDVLEMIPDHEAKKNTSFKTSGIKMYNVNKENLCLLAYHLLAEKYNLPPVKIHLHKIIPVGAGLGGGSSDAAFSLVMLNNLFDLKLTDEQLQDYATKLGSDCSFFIHNKPVFASGKGNEFEEIKLSLKNYFIILVKPKVHISTVKAYQHIIPKKPVASLKELIRQPITKWKETIQNDFEESIFKEFAVIRNCKSKLYNHGAVYASMSGSGSSVFGIFKEEKDLSSSFKNCMMWNGRLL